MAPTLAYWAIRGLAQPIRFALEYAGVEFEDKLYTNPDDWKQDKETLGLEFPNLPYFIDGDLKFTESTAIARHIARKHGLDGTTEQERIRIDVAGGILADQMRALAMLCYNENFESLKDDFILQKLPPAVEKLSKLVGSQKFIIGDKITYIDFFLYEILEKYVKLVPSSLDKFKNLQDYQKRIDELPAIKKYRASTHFKQLQPRYNGPSAKFGSGI